MSIYHHFPSKKHLLDALVDHAISSIDVDAPERDPVERLRHLLRSYRAMANRWPALYPLMAVHRLNTPIGVTMIERFLAAVHAVVPDTELAARHFRTLGCYITGAALDETAGCQRPIGRRAGWLATYELGLDALLERFASDGEAVRKRQQRRR